MTFCFLISHPPYIWETAGWQRNEKSCALRCNCEFLWVHAHTESQSPSPVVSHLASVSHWSARVHSAVSKKKNKKHKHLSRREISSMIHTQCQLLMEVFLAKQPWLYHPHTFRCDLGHLFGTIITLLYNSYYLQ